MINLVKYKEEGDNLIQLNVKSGYSFLASTLSVSQVIQCALDDRQAAVALTDVNGLFGVPEFLKECQGHAIKPIIGMEVLVQEQNGKNYPFILLAKNYEGYQNLTRLTKVISKNQQNFAIPFEALPTLEDNVFVIVPSVRSIFMDLWLSNQFQAIQEFIVKYKQSFSSVYFGMEFYGETIQADLIRFLRDQPLLEGLRVALQSVRYPQLQDQKVYHILQSISQGTTLEQFQPTLIGDESFHRSEDFYLENEVRLNEWISSQCNVDFPPSTLRLIEFPLPTGVTSRDDYLKALAWKGLEKRLGQKPTLEYGKRLTHELDVIIQMGFSNYFLVVYDYVKYAKTHGILVGPGRGSAAGSLVAYVLGITNVDPLPHGLLFERFLNIERITMPDIDIDFPDHQRNELIQYLRNKYTNEHFSHVIAFSTFGAKSALRDVGKVLSLNLNEVDFLVKRFPKNVTTLAEGLAQSTAFKDVLESREIYTKILEIAQRIEGLPRQTTLHAAGVVLSQLPLSEFVPVYEQEPGVIATQFSMDYLENFGLLKMDILGLRNLTIIDECLSTIKESANQTVVLPEIPLEDPKIYEMIKKGYAAGVFQLETAGMIKAIQTVQPTQFNDIVAILALFRPGPMDFIPEYARKKAGLQEVEFWHESLAPILAPTYGIIIYQEQILQILQVMAGFSLGKADIARRAISKKEEAKLRSIEVDFVNGSMARGYSESVAKNVFALILRFASYGFNKAHSVAYAVITAQMAWLKVHYPAAFFISVLNATTLLSGDNKLSQYREEFEYFNLKLLPPSVNFSQANFQIENKAIRYPLGTIKGINNQLVEAIILERNQHGAYEGFFEFVSRLGSHRLNDKQLMTLIDVGAFDEFKLNRATLRQSISSAMMFQHVESQNRHQDVEHPLIKREPPRFDYAPEDPIVSLEKEYDLLGMFLSGFPLIHRRQGLLKKGFITVFQAEKQAGKGSLVRLVLYTSEVRFMKTKKGETMAILNGMDESGSLTLFVFSDVLQGSESILKKGVFIEIEGIVDFRQGKYSMVAKKINQDEGKEG